MPNGVSSRTALFLVGLVVGPHVVCPALYFASGGSMPDGPTLYHVPLLIGAVLAVPIFAVASLLSLRKAAGPMTKTRNTARLAGLWIACTMLVVAVTPDRHAAAVDALAARAEPLAQAVGAYQRQHGRWPGSLEALVPGTLPALPDLRVPHHWVVYTFPPEGQTWGAPGFGLTIGIPRGTSSQETDWLVYVPPGAEAGRDGRRIGNWLFRRG